MERAFTFHPLMEASTDLKHPETEKDEPAF